MTKKKAKPSRDLLYRTHLVDSGQACAGAEGLYVGRKMRGEKPVVRLCCDPDCEWCEGELRA